MTMSVSFDTLAYAKRLKKAGFSETQAEVQAEALAEVVEERLATKQDLQNLEYRLVFRLGAIVTVGIAVMATLVKIL